MFSIGDFSKLTGLSVRTLRLYDELGLLRPVAAHPTTGYRRYSARQLPRVNRLLVLRDLGFTLAQIAPLLDQELSTDELRGMLILRRSQLAAQIEQEQERLVRIEALLRQIERENDMPLHDVVVRSLPAQRVVTIPSPAPGFGTDNLAPIQRPAYARLAALLAEQHVEPTGPRTNLYEGDPEEGTLITFPSIPIGDSHLDLPEGVEIRTVEATTAAATVVVNGLPDFHALYGDLAIWVEDHGYEVVGHGREAFLEFDPNDRQALVIEVQWPLRPIETSHR
jgi:DNA-binding transcriptional MerR regulator/effector-binding domain-containing protein